MKRNLGCQKRNLLIFIVFCKKKYALKNLFLFEKVLTGNNFYIFLLKKNFLLRVFKLSDSLMYSIFLCCTFDKKIKVFHSTPFKIMKDFFYSKHKVGLVPLLYADGVFSQVPASF